MKEPDKEFYACWTRAGRRCAPATGGARAWPVNPETEIFTAADFD
jgi:hypothetical protein